MRGAFFVAIALLVAAGSQEAAGFDQDEPQHGNDFMASANTIDEMLQNRVLQVSRNPKDDIRLLAGNEERAPSALPSFLKMVKAPDSISTAANVMRMEGEASAIEAASKNLNKLRSNERQRIAPTPNNAVGQRVRTWTNPEKAPVSVASDNSLKLAKRWKRKRPTAIVENAARSVTQHDHRPAPSNPSTINAKRLDRLYNQLTTQKALQLDKNEHLDGEENLREEDLGSFDLLHLFEESARLTVVNRQEASELKAASKNLIQLESNKRKRIAPTPTNVIELVVRTRPEPYEFSVLVANDIPSVLAKRVQTNGPTAIINNAARFLKQHDYRRAPPRPSTIGAEASDGRLNKQLIDQKAVQLDKNDHVDENLWREELISVDQLMHLLDEFDDSAHPTTTNRQEASAIEVATKTLNHLESNTHQRIASASNNVGKQVVHTRPDLDKSLVSVVNDDPLKPAKRRKTKRPTTSMGNAASFAKQHNYGPAPPVSSAHSAEAPNSRLNNQQIDQKALQLEKNSRVDDAESLRKDDSRPVEHLMHLREESDKFSHSTVVNHQNRPIDWTDAFPNGLYTSSKHVVNEEVNKVHVAFLAAFNLPFQQYLIETVVMLKLLRWKKNSSPNNAKTSNTLQTLAKTQKHSTLLQKALGPDLTKLLGEGETMVPNSLENLQEAYNVKLVIMYELFFNFCHERKDLVEGLPRKNKLRKWILKLSTLSSGNNNH